MKDSLPFFIFLWLPFWIVFVRAQECNLSAECIDSDVVTEYYTDTAKDCLKACKATPDCAWYTFVESADFCFMFSECKKLSNATCFDCISGEVTCPDTDCGLKGICEGHKLTIHQEVDSNNGCLKECQNEANCTWISYNSIENLCITYSTCEIINEDLEEFISSEVQCLPSKPKFTKLLVALGYVEVDPTTPDLTSPIEVIDLVDPNNRCSNLGSFERGSYGPIGGLLQDNNGTYLPIVCPQILNVDLPLECYVIKQNSVEFFVNVQVQDRINAASTILNNYNGSSLLWITGGTTRGNLNNFIQTTEIVRPDPISNQTELYQELPGDTPTALHCTVTVKDSVYFIGGGRSFPGNNAILVNQTLIFNYTSNQWFKGPPMMTPRIYHACVHFKDPQGASKIMVTGGLTGLNSYSSSVEILDLNSQTWSFGTYLPYFLYGHAMTAIEDTIYVIGGKGPNGLSGDIYQCIGGSSCEWELYPTKLQVPRRRFTAMLVPDELCEA